LIFFGSTINLKDYDEILQKRIKIQDRQKNSFLFKERTAW